MRATRTLFLFLLALHAAVAVTAQTSATKPAPPPPAPKAVAPKAPIKVEDVESDVAEALSIIEANHADAKRINYNDLFKSSIDSMLEGLDPHSSYLDAKEVDQFKTDQSSRYFGIGATIGDLTDSEGKLIGTYIKATFEGAPANRAGLRYGDKIVEVNGVSMIGKPFPEVRNSLRGPRGTSVKMVVERNATGKRETVELVRDAVPQPSIAETYMIRPETGYMAMTGGFNQTTFNEFRQGMQKLKGQGMKRLVLDLRNNGGGLVSQAYYIANTFIPRGQTIFTQKGRLDGTADTIKSNNSNPDDTPIVVLVNRYTASASEILAGALQDHDRALIVGESTFGKGLVQNGFPLEYGSMLLLTIAKYETPSGRLIQRDYSDGNLYNYYTQGGSLRGEGAARPTGEARKTDAGRVVYAGGGIDPDEEIKPTTLEDEAARNQVKLVNPLLAFSLDLVAGRVAGFESTKIDAGIKFGQSLGANEYLVSPGLFDRFRKFAVETYKLPGAVVDKERTFVERTLRTELVTAAYGSTTSLQVLNEHDRQLLTALELFPKALQLSQSKMTAPNGTTENR